MELYNYNEKYIPNIYHFQGVARNHYCDLFNKTTLNKITNNDNIKILTVATDESKSLLIKQLNNNNIKFINCYKEQFYFSWDNTNKIKLLIDQLEEIVKENNNQIVLILDGYDTIINLLDNLVCKFIDLNTKILFNATKHNYPNIKIDICPYRDSFGEFCYFNAGCCIGYAYYLLQFYKECLEISKNLYNPWNSEQYIVRNAYAKYSIHEQDFINFDYECCIFQTFGSTKLVKINDNKYKII